jgi:predicted ArsR family transcriptional regulator
MTSPDKKEAAKKRTELLVALRNRYPEGTRQAQAMLKEQQSTRKTLFQALQAGPQTIPQLSTASGIPAQEVLWHIAALKKYGQVEESGMDEDEVYYFYRLVKEGL